MLTFNNRRFAPLGSQPSDDAHGFYKLAAGRGVHLYKLNEELEAYIVDNARQGRFVVSASDRNGAPRYMFSTSSLTERWLGIEGASISATVELIKQIQHGAVSVASGDLQTV